MGKFETSHAADKPCAFRPAAPLTKPSAEVRAPAAVNRADQFQPVFLHADDEGVPHARRDPAEVIADAQRQARQRGLQSGREEARRLAQASLFPYLKSVADRLREMANQSDLAEERTGRDAETLAHAIMVRVTGHSTATAGGVEAARRTELESDAAEANRHRLYMNPDDLAYLKTLMRNEGFEWPAHPHVSVQGEATLAPNEFEIRSIPNDPAE